MAALLFRSSLRACLAVETAFCQRAALSTTARLAADRKYTKKHEWVVVENSVGTIGITEFAAEALGEVVFVDLPEVGKEVDQGDSISAVESVKAASDVYSPISGTVTERNEDLEDTPAKINKSPLGDGWIAKLKVKDASELKNLMDDEAYQEFLKEEEAH